MLTRGKKLLTREVDPTVPRIDQGNMAKDASAQAVYAGDSAPIKAQRKIRAKKHNIVDYQEVKTELQRTMGFNKNNVEELNLLEKEVANKNKAPIISNGDHHNSTDLKTIQQKTETALTDVYKSVNSRVDHAFDHKNRMAFESASDKVSRVFRKKKFFE